MLFDNFKRQASSLPSNLLYDRFFRPYSLLLLLIISLLFLLLVLSDVNYFENLFFFEFLPRARRLRFYNTIPAAYERTVLDDLLFLVYATERVFFFPRFQVKCICTRADHTVIDHVSVRGYN